MCIRDRINNSAVPSSEADARAYSFDIIPSSQLDNTLVVKSPAPEYPADFSGGFILVNSKDVPSSNLFTISVGTTLNDQTHFKKFLYNKGSGTDFQMCIRDSVHTARQAMGAGGT